MAKIIGYILALIGLAGLAFSSIPQLSESLPLPIPPSFAGTPLMVASVVVVVAGIFFVYRSGSGRQPKEVPIFQGKNVVGYRRMGK